LGTEQVVDPTIACGVTLEHVLSKALIWLSRERCVSQCSRAAIGVGLSLPGTRTSGICALQGTGLCCHWHITGHDALAPRQDNASSRSTLCPPPRAPWCATTHSGTGVEPVTARVGVWCSTVELPSRALAADTAIVRTHSRNAPRQMHIGLTLDAVRRWNRLNQPEEGTRMIPGGSLLGMVLMTAIHVQSSKRILEVLNSTGITKLFGPTWQNLQPSTCDSSRA
jgi:hypothetical protein